MVLALVLTIAVSPIRAWLTRKGAPAWGGGRGSVHGRHGLSVRHGGDADGGRRRAGPCWSRSYTDEFGRLAAQAQLWAAEHGISPQVNKALQSLNPAQILEFAQGLVSGVMGVLTSLFLMVVLLLAMSLDAPIISRVMAAAAAERPAMVGALTTFASKTRRYILVSTIFGLICAALDVVALYFLEVPLPLLWGLLALITNYIPEHRVRGGALVPPALLALLTGGVRGLVLVVVAYIVINVVVQSFIQPKFLGDAVGLTTTATFLSLIIWAWVLGALGALLAIPLTLLVRAVLIDSDPAAKWTGALVSGEIPRK
ncbi:putative PurR-regulated permease PerM [Sphaerisporangium siamense]|uniref:Putative PurR-regulated permease PerM n=1 Tax=Sphaerisporangium siamense TaxID=795645 RepID=A0A7W7GFX0_9ACTN|nr:AI-2E family transporter [Sphaerisporangium siamense]MBB4705491.1 putative PurR-regulated permease PerM [Sphaerisporangium siamense]